MVNPIARPAGGKFIWFSVFTECQQVISTDCGPVKQPVCRYTNVNISPLARLCSQDNTQQQHSTANQLSTQKSPTDTGITAAVSEPAHYTDL